jgi:hypothetical protein
MKEIPVPGGFFNIMSAAIGFSLQKHPKMKIRFLVIVTLLPVFIFCQELSISEMTGALNMDNFSVDTMMKKKGYRLMQKDADSVSTQYYYSNLERNEEAPTWVRSLSYIDVNLENIKSRMLTYRTYNRDEYLKLMSSMLSAGYKTKEVFDFKESKHTVFDNGKIPIRVKVTNNKMETGRMIRSYEFELGR